MDFKQKYEFEKLNKNEIWIDKCNVCCILKCGILGDFKIQCHCGNFEKSNCKECKHKDMCF